MKPMPRLSDLRRWQRILLVGIWAGFGLLLVTPLVVTVETAYPFTVGKAVYSRTLVAFVFALWVALAVANTAYRPPRSWLLGLLAAGFVVSLLAAASGINIERSLWSTYERMQGVVNAAHWLALAVVLVAVVRDGRQWRLLFGLNIAVSVAVAALAIGRFHGLDMPYLGDVAERSWRISASFGNSALLGHYALLNCFLAAGMAAWWLTERGPSGDSRWARWSGGACWAGAALLNLWALALSGALAAFVALVLAAGALALAYALFGSGASARRAGSAGLVVIGTVGLVLAALFFVRNPLTTDSDHPLLRRLSSASIEGRTSQTRLAAWDAGIKGAVERPVLGWGPDNYIVPYGKYAAGIATTYDAHDHPHSEFIEEAATKGVLGAAAYVALWVWIFVVLVRTVRRGRGSGPPPAGVEQALPLFVGAALVAEAAFKQTLFANIVGSLQYTLLFGFVVGLEAAMGAQTRRRGRLERLSDAVARWLDRRVIGAVVVVLAVGVSALASYSNVRIYQGANALLRFAAPGSSMSTLDETISAFPPMANYGRRLFFDDLANNWRRLRMQRGAEAARLLARADIEAEAAELAEPNNWIVLQSLARLYGVVALTNPEYKMTADRYLHRSLALAPTIELRPPRD